MELYKNYRVVVCPEFQFNGIYYGVEDNYYKFITLETNDIVNNGGNGWVKVPATFFVNPNQIMFLEQLEDEDKQKEYKFNKQTVLLTEEQKEIWEKEFGVKIEEKIDGEVQD